MGDPEWRHSLKCSRVLLERQEEQKDLPNTALAASEIPDPGSSPDAGVDRPELEKRHY